LLEEKERSFLINGAIRSSIDSHQKLLELVPFIERIADKCLKAIQSGGTIFLFGNGGSASDAQHIAAEFIGRFSKNRRSLPALALTVNTSNLTAIANDYGYEYVFSRQLEGLLRKNDLVVGISTSGASKNVLEGIILAKSRGCFTIGLSGGSGGKLKDLADICLIAPASTPARIQEIHILVGHIISEVVESGIV
jgi:D-sedoheptulose 7-phosphate isomerase